MMEELEKVRKLSEKRQSALEKLVGPARAAANQMRDAGMVRGAKSVDPKRFVEGLVEAMEQKFKKE